MTYFVPFPYPPATIWQAGTQENELIGVSQSKAPGTEVIKLISCNFGIGDNRFADTNIVPRGKMVHKWIENCSILQNLHIDN